MFTSTTASLSINAIVLCDDFSCSPEMAKQIIREICKSLNTFDTTRYRSAKKFNLYVTFICYISIRNSEDTQKCKRQTIWKTHKSCSESNVKHLLNCDVKEKYYSFNTHCVSIYKSIEFIHFSANKIIFNLIVSLLTVN